MSSKKKCFSKCRKKTKENCGPKICKYINGSKYQYCRLGNNYKLDDDCNITRKNKKKKITKKQARVLINEFVNKTKKNKVNTKSLAFKKIQKFMINNRFKIKSNFLQSVCSDSGMCLVFGTKTTEIKNFFNNYINFDFAKSPLKRIGNISDNGFVNEITYKREKYVSNSIIKSSINKNSDNLFYEYLCGIVVNKWNKVFPCFLETYGLFAYKDEISWSKVKDNNTTSISVFNKSVDLLCGDNISVNSELFNKVLKNSCDNSKYIAIMIQHLKDVVSLNDLIINQEDKHYFFNNELILLLFQVYYPLHILKNNYTHYDLHLDNVLIYQPNRNGYIEYNYVLLNGNTIRFKSKYIVKIIDYGRSFFDDDTNEHLKSKYIRKKICNETSCKPYCGSNVGYSWLNLSGALRNQYYIYSMISNKSHDLRLLKILKDMSKIYKINKNIYSIYSFLNKVKYNTHYGTPVAKINKYPTTISDVTDAFKGLSELIDNDEYQENNNNNYLNIIKLGDLYIYENGRPMKFVSM